MSNLTQSSDIHSDGEATIVIAGRSCDYESGIDGSHDLTFNNSQQLASP
jgi:hypothetical protein